MASPRQRFYDERAARCRLTPTFARCTRLAGAGELDQIRARRRALRAVRPAAWRAGAGGRGGRLARSRDRRAVRRLRAVAGPLPPVGLAGRAVRDHHPELRPPRPKPGQQRPGEPGVAVPALPLAPRPASAHPERVPQPAKTVGRRRFVRLSQGRTPIRSSTPSRISRSSKSTTSCPRPSAP